MVKRTILELDLKTFEYGPRTKAKFKALEAVKDIEDLKTRVKTLVNFDDKAGEFYRRTFYDIFKYVTFRIPEISDELYRIDQAVCAGFAWQIGPFDTWDLMGVQKVVSQMEAMDLKPAAWVYEMLEGGNDSFYKIENGFKKYYDIPSKSYKTIPGTEGLVILENIRETNKVWGNAGASLFDIGDGVLCLEFHTKMNAIGQEVIEGIETAISMAEKDYKGLVIGNEGENFSAGANLAMLFMFAGDQEFDEDQLDGRAIPEYDEEGEVLFYTGSFCSSRFDTRWWLRAFTSLRCHSSTCGNIYWVSRSRCWFDPRWRRNQRTYHESS